MIRFLPGPHPQGLGRPNASASASAELAWGSAQERTWESGQMTPPGLLKRKWGRGRQTPGCNFALEMHNCTTGTEVDIVVETAGRLVPIEVKLSATPRPAMASSIRAFQEAFGDKAMPGYVVHPGDTRLPLGSNVTALPFAEL